MRLGSEEVRRVASGHVVNVIDVGTARVKISHWTCTESGLVRTGASTVDLHGGPGDIAETLGLEVAPVARQSAANGDVVAITGGHRVRNETHAAKFAQALADEVRGVFLPLEPRDEGAMLAVSNGVDHETLLLDVGGGSTQFIWVEAGRLHARSTAHGTYSVEQRFNLPFGSGGKRYDDAYSVIASEVGALPQRRRLVCGSNIVGTFFNRLGDWFGRPPTWSAEEVSLAARDVRRLNPTEFGRIFPDMPGFMFGADKLLALLSVITAACGASEISGTDASVSHGVALTLAGGLECPRCQATGRWLSLHNLAPAVNLLNEL